MAKYTSDANLIKGAATAYKNYDNVAGMYAGLDKVTKAGTDMMGEAVKGYEAEQERVKKEQEKLEQEARKEQEKADKLNDNWNTLASGVYESAGSFMKDVEYKDTVASVKALRQEYIDAQNSKDAEKMAEVKIKFNNINAEVNAHKEFRALLTNPEYGMSDFVKGDNLEYMNGFINEDYVIGRNDKKEKTYTVNGVTKTMKEINEMVGVKDNVPYGKYGKLVNDYSKSKSKGNRDNLEAAIRNGIVPDNTNALRAFLNDDGFGNGQTFSDLLNEKGNRAGIEKEIMNTFDDGDGIISETEYENFVNAIVSPDNEFWKNNGGSSAWKKQSKTIATELLANGAENAWDTNPANKTVVTPGATDKTGGHVGSSLAGVGWVPAEKKQEYRGYIDKFADFQGNYGNWVFDKDKGEYYDSGAEEKVFISAYDVAQKEDAAKGDPAEDFFYSPDSKTQVELGQEQKKGLATWDMLNFENDDDAALELNDWFGFKGNSSVKFKPYRPDFSITGISDVVGESVLTNDLMIVNPVSGEPYKDDEGNIYRFSTDGGKQDLQKVINSINSNPIISKFIKPRTKPSA